MTPPASPTPSPTPSPTDATPHEATGMAVIVRDDGEYVLLADCPACPDGGVYGHAVLRPGDPPGTTLRDPQARCDRCGAVYVFEIGWTEALESVESVESVESDERVEQAEQEA